MTDAHNRLRAPGEELARTVKKDVDRIKQAEKERPTLVRLTIYLSCVGLMFVAPVVGGAYLGLWLDRRFHYYGAHWTVCLIVLGVVFGAFNVYHFIKE